MRTKVTIFLLLLVAGLIGFIFYYQPPWNTNETFNRQNNQILGAESSQIDYLSIHSAKSSIQPTLEKTRNGWNIVQPVKWPANFFAVNRILTQLQFLERKTSFKVSDLKPHNQSLADFGLDPAQIVLTYGYNGQRHELKIGRPTDTGDSVYILSPDGSTIYVVNRALLDSLSVDLQNLRSNSIFLTPVFEIHSWNIQMRDTPDLRVRLTRHGDNWVFETPIQTRANRSAVEAILAKITNLKIESFYQDSIRDPNLLGLSNPTIQLTLESTNGRRESLLIGNPVVGKESQNEYYARLEDKDKPTIFIVKIDFLKELENAQNGLRERRLFSLKAKNIQTLALNRVGHDPITLQKLENGQWQVVSRGSDQSLKTLPADPEVVTRLIDRLLDVSAVPDGGFVTDAPSDADLENFGLTGPLWRISLTAHNPPPDSGSSDSSGANLAPTPESVTQTLLLGAFIGKGTDRLYAKLEDSKFVYAVDASILQSLWTLPVRYRDRELQQLSSGARITALKITRLGQGDVLFSASLGPSGQSWKQALQSLPGKTRKSALKLISLLRDFRARNFLQNDFSSSLNLGDESKPWTYLLQATISLDGGQTEQTNSFRLYLSDVNGGTTLVAGSPDLNLVFETDQSFIDAFSDLVSGRTDPGEPPPDPADLIDESPPIPSPTAPKSTAATAPSPDSAPAKTQPAPSGPTSSPATQNDSSTKTP